MRKIDLSKYQHISSGRSKPVPDKPYARLARNILTIYGFKPSGERRCAAYRNDEELVAVFATGKRKYTKGPTGVCINSKKIMYGLKPGCYNIDVGTTELEGKEHQCVVVLLKDPIKFDINPNDQQKIGDSLHGEVGPGLRECIGEYIALASPAVIFYARDVMEYCNKRMQSRITTGQIKQVLASGSYPIEGNGKIGYRFTKI